LSCWRTERLFGGVDARQMEDLLLEPTIEFHGRLGITPSGTRRVIDYDNSDTQGAIARLLNVERLIRDSELAVKGSGFGPPLSERCCEGSHLVDWTTQWKCTDEH
jgi:hypothetical protein